MVAQTLAVASRQTDKDIFAFIHSFDSCSQLLLQRNNFNWPPGQSNIEPLTAVAVALVAVPCKLHPLIVMYHVFSIRQYTCANSGYQALLSPEGPGYEATKGYACARTKTAAILNNAVAPAFKRISNPFSILIDGSNDSGLDKMNPITVKIFDTSRDKVQSRFLDMCLTNDARAATAEEIFCTNGSGFVL